MAPVRAHAQSNRGAIGVAVTILPAPVVLSRVAVTLSGGGGDATLLRIASEPANAAHRITAFVRLTRGDSDDARLAFVAQPAGSSTTLRLAPSPGDVRLRLERLVTAGT